MEERSSSSVSGQIVLFTLASVSVVGEGKEEKTRMCEGFIFLPLRTNEAVSWVLWHLRNVGLYLSCEIRILY